jgi:acetyl esterase/lipase
MGKGTMRQRLVTTAVTVMLAAGCNPFVVHDGGFWVQGLVVDRAGKPVPNVIVNARNELSVTDQHGCFQIIEITYPYKHEMPFSVTAAGYRSFVGTVTTSSAAKRRFRVSLAEADSEPDVKTMIDTASTEAAIGQCDVTRPGQGAPGFTPPAVAAHTYREIDGVALKAFVFAPSGQGQKSPAPAILLFHGGGWAAGSPDWTFAAARRFAAAGLVAISVQYRLSDERSTPIDALADVCASFHWVRAESARLGVQPQRIAASGVSAGGHLAATAATVGCGNTEGEYGIGGPDALVLWSPALDVSGDESFRRLLRDRATVQAYSPVEHVRPRMPPTHIVHGDRDTLTPLRGAQRFCDSVRAGGGVCELVVYPGVGHLLTRNLANQESDFDPDPAAREDGNSRQQEFVRALWRK